ncbi:MAG: 50S ribosomal protein L9 [Candidatus Omnitrophica bacterium]|nr:50S ribosomal protein L9 [Candidatus Omnitrophota bacterium]
MEVILVKDIEKIGKAGVVIKVKDGFAHNFLFPKGLAIGVTQGNLKKLEEDKKKIVQELEKKKIEAQAIKERLEGLSLTIASLAQNETDLYGSIGVQDIADLLKDEGVAIEKNLIQLTDPIKTLGVYEIPVKLHSEIFAKLKVWVVKK